MRGKVRSLLLPNLEEEGTTKGSAREQGGSTSSLQKTSKTGVYGWVVSSGYKGCKDERLVAVCRSNDVGNTKTKKKTGTTRRIARGRLRLFSALC